MTEKNSPEIDALRCTLDLSANESAEVEKLNNADLLNNCKLDHLSCLTEPSSSQEAANIGSLETVNLNRACSSSHTSHIAEAVPISVSARSNRISKTRSSKIMNPSPSTPDEIQTLTPEISHNVTTSDLSSIKDEQVVLIDGK